MRAKHALFGIIAAAVVLRLAVFAALLVTDAPNPFEMTDTRGYQMVAWSLLGGHGFSQSTTSPYLPDSMRTPVLPLALAATEGVFGTQTPYIFVQIVLSAVLIFLTYKLGLLIAGQRPALVAAVLMAFEPYAVFVNTSLLTETLFAVTITAASYCAFLYARDHSLKQLAAASALFAFAALTRPIVQFMPLLLIVLVLFVERPRTYGKYLAAAVIPFLVVASPWLIRNYTTFGIAGFSSGGFQNVYSNIGASIISYRDGSGWTDAKNALEADFAARHGVPVSTIQQDLTLSPVLFHEGLALMVGNPIPTAQSFMAIVIAFFTNDAWSYYLQRWGWMDPFEYGFSPTKSLITDGPVAVLTRIVSAGNTAPLLIAVAGRVFWVIIDLLLFLGVLLLIREKGTRRVWGLMILITLLYHLGLTWSVGDGVNGRYRYPLDPLIFTTAVLGAAAVARRLQNVVRLHRL